MLRIGLIAVLGAAAPSRVIDTHVHCSNLSLGLNYTYPRSFPDLGDHGDWTLADFARESALAREAAGLPADRFGIVLMQLEQSGATRDSLLAEASWFEVPPPRAALRAPLGRHVARTTGRHARGRRLAPARSTCSCERSPSSPPRSARRRQRCASSLCASTSREPRPKGSATGAFLLGGAGALVRDLYPKDTPRNWQ